MPRACRTAMTWGCSSTWIGNRMPAAGTMLGRFEPEVEWRICQWSWYCWPAHCDAVNGRIEPIEPREAKGGLNIGVLGSQ